MVAALVGLGYYERQGQRFGTGDDYARYHDHSFRVVRVLDGDTFDIDAPDGEWPATRIRLWGVDTPEVAHENLAGMYFGDEAHAFAERTLAGQTVHLVLVPQETRGKYGRLLAYVYLQRDGAMFNELLISQGCGYADRRFEHPYLQNFVLLENRARRDQAGLWAGVRKEQMPKWRQKYEGQ